MMSNFHVVANILIGAIVGFFADLFSLQRVPFGLFSFVAVGIAGSFAGDFLFRVLVINSRLPFFFYSRTSILLETVLVSCLFVYLFSLIKWDYK